MDQAQQNLPVLAYIVIESPNGIKTEMSFQLDFDCTNKQAEYEALIISLEILADFRLSTVRIIGDSQLVLKQVCGEYKCSSLSLAPYFAMAVQLMDEFDDVSVQYVPREENKDANQLAQVAAGLKIPSEFVKKAITIEKRSHPSISGRGVTGALSQKSQKKDLPLGGLWLSVIQLVNQVRKKEEEVQLQALK